MKKILLLFLTLMTPLSFCNDHHSSEDADLPLGITTFNKSTKEFSLKENVIKNFDLSYQDLSRSKNDFEFEVPNESIVKSLQSTHIFILKNNLFRSIEIKILKPGPLRTLITTAQDLTQAKVVVKGNNFLQTILLFLIEGPANEH